jgi:hypothetical protein
MIEHNAIQCALKLDNLFSEAETKYEKLFLSVSQSTPFDLTSVKNKWLSDPINPLLIISTQLVKNYQGASFKEEINNNILNNNIGYFNYVTTIVDKRIHFLKKFFSYSLSTYFNYPTRRTELLEKLYSGGELSKNEFITAVQLDFIEKCELLEITYQKYYPDYTIQLTSQICPTEIDGAVEPILLAYKEKNSVVVKELHSLLYKTYIAEDFDTFSAHFVNQTNVLPAIKWEKSLMLLCVIFNGAYLKDRYSSNVTGIKTSNSNLKRMLNQHFCMSNGDEIGIGTLNTNLNRLSTRRKVKGVEPIIKPLKTISLLL